MRILQLAIISHDIRSMSGEDILFTIKKGEWWQSDCGKGKREESGTDLRLKHLGIWG